MKNPEIWKEQSLTEAQPGDIITILERPDDTKISIRLSDIGLIPGKRMTVLSGTKNTAYILLSEQGLKIGVNWDVARQIRILSINQQSHRD